MSDYLPFCNQGLYKAFKSCYSETGVSLVAQKVKNLPTVPQGQGSIPGLGSPGEGNGNSSVLAWKIPRTDNLVGYSPRGGKELDTTERLTQ